MWFSEYLRGCIIINIRMCNILFNGNLGILNSFVGKQNDIFLATTDTSIFLFSIFW